MRKTTATEIQTKCPAQRIHRSIKYPETFSGIGTDTRKDLKGQLFWALKGESFDAHDFLATAVAQGATGLVIERLPTDQITDSLLKDWDVHVFKVDDTLKALQNFAGEVRRELKAQVVGITGSNGKTSTKEFLATLLKNERRVHWNPGSFNNHFGLPFNILQTPIDSDVLIAEMGMNHAGELTELCHIARPDVVVCTMVGSAHIEHFGSAAKIAAAKEEIYIASPPQAVRIFNADNEWTKKMAQRARTDFPVARILQFSNAPASLKQSGFDVVLVKDETAPVGSSWGLSARGRIGSGTEAVEDRVETRLLGDHNLVNLAAAATCALALGLRPEQIWKNLAACEPHWGRMQPLKSAEGAMILFDGYNANPESMQALLQSLDSAALRQRLGMGRKFAVLAEMRELGESAEAAHHELGRWVAAADFTGVYFYGPSHRAVLAGFSAASSGGKNLVTSDGYEESLAIALASMLNPKDLVVVKGSRGMKTERFVQLLKPANFNK